MAALIVGVVVSIPLGVWASRRPRIEHASLVLASIVQTIPSLALLALMVLAVFGRTGPEAARIWMFMTPFVCLVAAGTLAKLPAAKARIVVPLVLGLQGVTVIMIKVFQDF